MGVMDMALVIKNCGQVGEVPCFMSSHKYVENCSDAKCYGEGSDVLGRRTGWK